jgi:hypothetical protein
MAGATGANVRSGAYYVDGTKVLGARSAAYTQTYNTADRTLAAYTSDPENAAYTGLGTGAPATPYAQVSNLNALRVAYENLRTFTEDLAAFVNALVDDLQTHGTIG